MTESFFTRKLLKALRSHPALLDAVIWKHNDASTGGIPDFSVSWGRVTLWFEVKLGRNIPTKLQRWALGKLRDGGILISVSRDGRDILIGPQGELPRLLSFDELVEEIVRRCVNA